MNVVCIGLTMVMLIQTLSAQQSCDSLTGLKLPHSTITSSTMISEGPVAIAGSPGGSAAVIVPARCVVKGTTMPTKDSEIKFGSGYRLPAGTENSDKQGMADGPEQFPHSL